LPLVVCFNNFLYFLFKKLSINKILPIKKNDTSLCFKKMEWIIILGSHYVSEMGHKYHMKGVIYPLWTLYCKDTVFLREASGSYVVCEALWAQYVLVMIMEVLLCVYGIYWFCGYFVSRNINTLLLPTSFCCHYFYQQVFVVIQPYNDLLDLSLVYHERIK
jgi:hypothetical protein